MSTGKPVAGTTPTSLRCGRDEVEEALSARRRDLISELELVLFDTTSIHCEKDCGETLAIQLSARS